MTLDRTRSGPDHAMSLEPAEFAAMVAAIRATADAIGDGDKVPTEAEREIAAVARRSLHWARDLSAGETIARRRSARAATGYRHLPGADARARRPPDRSPAFAAGAMVEEGDA